MKRQGFDWEMEKLRRRFPGMELIEKGEWAVKEGKMDWTFSSAEKGTLKDTLKDTLKLKGHPLGPSRDAHLVVSHLAGALYSLEQDYVKLLGAVYVRGKRTEPHGRKSQPRYIR